MYMPVTIVGRPEADMKGNYRNPQLRRSVHPLAADGEAMEPTPLDRVVPPVVSSLCANRLRYVVVDYRTPLR